MRHISEFIADSGRWGVASEIAALVVFVVGLLEHINDKPVPGFTFVGISMPLFWMGAYAAWAKKRSEVEVLRRQSLAVPHIKAVRPGLAAKLKDFRVGNAHKPASCLSIYFKNDPQFNSASAVANDVIATIDFYDANPPYKHLVEMHGRWADSAQPTSIQQSSAEFRTAKFNIGEARELDIAFKYVEEPDCYAVNSENWFHVAYKDENKLLDCPEITAKIRLIGTDVDRTWTVKFRNRGTHHQLEPLEYGPID
jgi:hypothetical protein